jgi:hypothetical protein
LKVEPVAENDEKVTLKYTQDVSAALKSAEDARREDRERGAFQKSHDMKRTFCVPFGVLMDIQARTGLDFFKQDDAKAIVKILKGPDYAKFRTTDKARR